MYSTSGFMGIIVSLSDFKETDTFREVFEIFSKVVKMRQV